jgi:hypothetical protein
MSIAEPLRDQQLDGLPEEFVALEPEHALSLGVHHLDRALRVDHHHRVRSELYYSAETFFAFAERHGDLGDRFRNGVWLGRHVVGFRHHQFKGRSEFNANAPSKGGKRAGVQRPRLL